MIDENRLIQVLEKNFGHTGGASVIKQIIDKQPKVGEWIPVEERLPKEKEYVLIHNPYGVMSVACLLDGKWYNFQGIELWVAVAWMPLPEPYRKDQ